MFISVNVAVDLGSKKSRSKLSRKANPDRSLCRYEFLEVLVRIAKAMYVFVGRMAGCGLCTPLFDHASNACASPAQVLDTEGACAQGQDPRHGGGCEAAGGGASAGA